jgi:hypothetical protein
LAPERFLIPEYSVVAEDLGAGVAFVEPFVELRETAMREKEVIRVVAIKFAAQTIEGLRMKLRGKRAMLIRPSSRTLGTSQFNGGRTSCRCLE